MKTTFLFLFIVSTAFAQEAHDVPAYFDWNNYEVELARLGQNCIRQKTEEQRLAAADTFADLLEKKIYDTESFSYPFEKVTNLSKLIAPDKSFRIYTWSVPMRDGSFTFYGRLVLNEQKVLRIVKLTDAASSLENPENMLLKPEQWYGAIYYDIIPTKEKGSIYYTLLGYRPNNSTHHEKILEPLCLENSNKLRFGAKIFNTPLLNTIKYKRPPYRLILRYSPKSSASVKYIVEEKRIVMDHLAPADVVAKDDWARYGPDFSYQALFWEDGHWQLEDEITIKGDVAPVAPQPTQQGLPKK